MPKITVHGGASNQYEPQPRPGEGVFFQPSPVVDAEPVEPAEAPLVDDGDADDAADTEQRLEAGDKPATSGDTPAEVDTAADAEQPEPAVKPRARKRPAAGATTVEGS